MGSLASSVLLIEPDPALRTRATTIDVGSDLVLHVCSGAAEADRITQRLQFDVAITRRSLPDGDGLDWLMRMHRRDPDCFRVLKIHGDGVDLTVDAVNRGQIDAFLVDPWRDDQLIQLVHQGCESALLRRHNRSLVRELGSRNADLLAFNDRLEELVRERTRHLDEAHERLRVQQQEMIRLETQAALAQLVRGMAHELNNPLAVIVGYVQRMRRMGAGNEDLVRRLDTVLGEAERCSSLVSQLASLAQPLAEARIACDPAEIARQALTHHQGPPGPGLAVDGVLPPVQAAPHALLRCFVEIYDNAVAFGARTWTLSARSDGETVELRLANDGRTPEPEALRQAGRPFFTTRISEGRRGLGLALVAGLMRDMDGSMALAPGPGGTGALIALTLPRAAPTTQLPALQSAANGCILIVDDEPLIAELMQEALVELDLQVEIAATAAAAMARCGSGGIRAAIIDWHLPDGSGVDLAMRLAAAHPSLGGHLAITTGDDGGEQARIAAETGMPVLSKPFRLERVQNLVQELLKE